MEHFKEVVNVVDKKEKVMVDPLVFLTCKAGQRKKGGTLYVYVIGASNVDANETLVQCLLNKARANTVTAKCNPPNVH